MENKIIVFTNSKVKQINIMTKKMDKLELAILSDVFFTVAS